MKKYRALILIIIAFVCYNSLFINKALHIDDPPTLGIARVANIDFFRAAKGYYTNPPLIGYYYAPIIRLCGEKEWVLHLFYFPFSILAVISMYFLCQRFAKGSQFPLLFLIVTPAFIISSHSIMLDIPLLAFFLTAITSFVYGLDKNNNILLSISGVCAAAAILTKYAGLMLIPILLLYGLFHSHRKKTVFLLIPLGVFALWNAYCIFVFREFFFYKRLMPWLERYLFNGIGIRMLAVLSFLSGTSVIVLLLSPFLANRKNAWSLVLSFFAGTMPFILQDIFIEYTIFEKSALAILFSASAFMLILVCRNSIRGIIRQDCRDQIFLGVWFLLALAFSLLTNFIAARFFLLLFPPLFLLLHHELADNPLLRPRWIAYAVFITLFISTILALGDYQAAGAFRHFTSYASRKFPERDNTYFFTSGYYLSWEYPYYLQRDFSDFNTHKDLVQNSPDYYAILITPTEALLPIVVLKKDEFDRYISENYRSILRQSVSYYGKVFLHHKRYRTGFYCHDWGLLPFVFSLKERPLERFEVYRLSLKI